METQRDTLEEGPVMLGAEAGGICHQLRMPHISANAEARMEQGLPALRRNQPCGYLDLGLLASRTVRTNILFEATRFMVMYYNILSKPID